MIKKRYVIGYSLDACLFARESANSGEKVVFIESDILGYPYDVIGEFFRKTDISLIESRLGEPIECDILHDNRYVFVPYNSLKMVNSKNGLVSYPINKLSFECAKESEEVLESCTGIDVFINKITSANNYVNLFKSFFPKWLYESILRYVSINKWCGIKQSKLTRFALLKELDTSYINMFGHGKCYRPVSSYNEICEKLLTHTNIVREKIKPNQLGDIIKKRFTDGAVYVMDNRVDMAVGYHHGMLERVNFSSELTSENGIEELMDVDTGIVLTPMKPYWCITTKYGISTKIYSKIIDKPNDYTLSVLSPTNNNAKMVADYANLLTFYSDKKLNLMQYVKPTII